MEDQTTISEEVPTRKQKGISALSVAVLLTLSLVGSHILRDQFCNPNTQTYDFFTCLGINGFMLGHVLIAEKPVRDGIECISPSNE